MDIPIVIDADGPPLGSFQTVNDACPGCGAHLTVAEVAVIGGALERQADGRLRKRLYAVCTPCWGDPARRRVPLKMHFFPVRDAPAFALLMNSLDLHAPRMKG